jgi:glycogen synthase
MGDRGVRHHDRDHGHEERVDLREDADGRPTATVDSGGGYEHWRSSEERPHTPRDGKESVYASHHRLLAVVACYPDDMAVGLGALVEPLSVASHALERAYQPGLPHLREGFGMVNLEAMACATPVVASDSASIPEVVRDAGRLVDPHDDNAACEFAAALDRALEVGRDEDALERSHRFSWERSARETLQTYEHCL